MKKGKLLVVAAHPDDEILGCGGAILKLKEKNDINVLFMTNGVSARGKNKISEIKRKNACLKLFKYLGIPKPEFLNFPDNQLDKVPLLKIIKKIEKKINLFKPDTIFTHYSDCLNIDHRKTFEAVNTACRPINKISVKKILSFEIPSSTDWALFKGKNFQPNYYIDISKYLNEKINLIKFYKDELRNYPHSRSIKSIKTLASFRGVCCGVKYAEGFYLSRCLD
jgi:N-acetylglucosamine malate deacetylase 1